jgi:ABC-type Fe3+-hydroxamate transport system substrate-binding protein
MIMKTNKLRTRVLWLTLIAVVLSISTFSQTTSAPSAASKSIPVVDGGIGPCSAEFTVTDAAGTPVYAASIKVHIAYRFMSAHKLDLEVGTNSDGKARFTGFPERVKRGLYFEASEGDRTAEAFDDPANTCKTQFTLVLRKKP